ncbi:hypothetical protein MLD38_011210 [Melastoma candidum]|uniref:Uncharacterized protein n=1 Tax=Melastoma candidum TaxID=119954 RepID=A0ACB9R5C9_9MYRT|nr:hypothetical protein MLD38_011210 [Melastoma candidum]
MGSSSMWRKAKLALGLNLSSCVYPPGMSDDDSRVVNVAARGSGRRSLLLSRSGCDSSKVGFQRTCSICLNKMKQGGGQAVFTAECSHSFHFHCIAMNIKFGNQICPVCRAKWKEVPSEASLLINPPQGQRDDLLAVMARRRDHANRRDSVPLFQFPEPSLFDDDGSLDQPSSEPERDPSCGVADGGRSSRVQIKLYPEVSVLPRATSCGDFSFLVNVKAARTNGRTIGGNCRASVDLVTVIDISGSMAGTKLALLKRAMGFVIQNLSSNDRLSVVAFSSTARRLFPLCRMSDAGRQQALRAVNSLVATGGTNIAEGLAKGAKVISDRKHKNPVASIILLSDGQDNYAPNDGQLRKGKNNYPHASPSSLGSDAMGFQLPVHTFGFGIDHDAPAMHSISEVSGGTFSFIETEAVIQDAFAQCIGGLLSVVVQELQVRIDCVHPSMQLVALKAGNYPGHILLDGRAGVIDGGNLYADEERDFLVSVNIPEEWSIKQEMPLPRVKCSYKDPLTMESVTVSGEEVNIRRAEVPSNEVRVSLEVDRQRNRLGAAEAMSQARALAEQGDLKGAATILENCRQIQSQSISAKSNDRLCIALDAEMKGMQERLSSTHEYRMSGRAYILSGLSSHSWQRATARGDSTERHSLIQAYQTPSMTELITQSQATASVRRPSAMQRSLTSSRSHTKHR